MGYLGAGSLPLLFLNLVHQRLNFLLKLGLELFFHLSVLFELLSIRGDRYLKPFSGSLTLSEDCLVLGNISFQIVENREFFIEGDKSVQFVFELDFFLFKQELELAVFALL